MKLTSSYYTGESPRGTRPSPDGAVHPGLFADHQWPWDSEISRCNEFDLQPAPKPHTPSDYADGLDIFLDNEFDRLVDRAAAIGVGGRDGGLNSHATHGRRAHQKAHHNGSWPFPRRRTALNRVRKGMTFGSNALEPANLAKGSIGVNGQRVHASVSDSDAMYPAGAERSGSAAIELADEALAYLENALGNGPLSDRSANPSGKLIRGPASGGAYRGRRTCASNFNMAELAGLAQSLGTAKMPPFPPRYCSQRREKKVDRLDGQQSPEPDESPSEIPADPVLTYRPPKKLLSDRLKNDCDLSIKGFASNSKSHKGPPMASPDAVDSFLNTFMTSIGHRQSPSPDPPVSGPEHEPPPNMLLNDFRSRPSCFRVHKADMPGLNVMGVGRTKNRPDKLQQLPDPRHHHQNQNHRAQWPEPGRAADLLNLSLDSAEGQLSAAGDMEQDRVQYEAEAVARGKSDRRKSLSAPKARTVQVAAEKRIAEEQSRLEKSWRWTAQHSRGSSAVSGTEIWDFRHHLETPTTANKPYKNDNPWHSPASRRQPRV